MSIPKLTEATICRHAHKNSVELGEADYQAGAVATLTQWGKLLLAEVEDQEAVLCTVTLRFDEVSYTYAHCTCAHNLNSYGISRADGWCRHIVATVLVCARQPKNIEERPSLERLLDRLDLVQTQRLIQDLVAEQPELIEPIDRLAHQINQPSPDRGVGKLLNTIMGEATGETIDTTPRTQIDPAPFRRQVKQILRDAIRDLEAGYEDDPVTDQILDLIQQAQELAEQGDGNGAIVILEAIATTCISEWDEVADYGIYSDLITEELDSAFTGAILNASLSQEEKVVLQDGLELWQDGLDGDFAMSLEALRQGWDYPVLRQILEGEVSQLGAREEAPPEFAPELAQIRLQVLDRQERYSEYLYLAEAEGQTQMYLTMLSRLGRVDEVMALAPTQMASMETAFALAQTLQQQGATDSALAIAKLGLTLPGQSQYVLGIWTSELAKALSDRPTALSARILAFKAQPLLADYQKLAELAGDAWATIKPELLEVLYSLPNFGNAATKIDIFLEEDQIDAAIAVANDLRYETDLLHQVMKAAIAHNPDWVIDTAQQRAETIMNAGKAESYAQAIDWLKQAQAAYRQAGQLAEWAEYRAQLIQIHGRKYKLMGLLKALT